MTLDDVRNYLTRYLESIYIRPIELGSAFQGYAFMGRFYGRNNACIGWPYEPIGSIVEEIRKQDNRISEKAIRALFQNAAVELVEENLVSEDGDPNADANVESLLGELSPEVTAEKAKALHDALGQSVHDFQVFVPLEGIELNVAEFPIAGGVLYPKDSPRISDLVDKTSFSAQVKVDIQAVYFKCSAFFMCSQEGDEYTSVQFGRARAKEAVHLLRFYLTPDDLRAQRDLFQIRLLGEPKSDGRFAFICHNIDDIETMRFHWSQELGAFRRYQLGTEQIDFMQGFNFETLHHAIDSTQKKGEIESRISRAIRWFSYAVAAHEVDQKFVGYAVALESLLTDSAKPDPSLSWGSITQKLAERCAFLLSGDFKKRKEIEKEVKDLYGMRSQIVHGGSPVSETNTVRIQVMARSAILALASHGFPNWKAFLEWIDQCKYG